MLGGNPRTSHGSLDGKIINLANYNNSLTNVAAIKWDDSRIKNMIPGFGRTGFGHDHLPR